MYMKNKIVLCLFLFGISSFSFAENADDEAVDIATHPMTAGTDISEEDYQPAPNNDPCAGIDNCTVAVPCAENPNADACYY